MEAKAHKLLSKHKDELLHYENCQVKITSREDF